VLVNYLGIFAPPFNWSVNYILFRVGGQYISASFPVSNHCVFEMKQV
jgi:hypothetical protein